MLTVWRELNRQKPYGPAYDLSAPDWMPSNRAITADKRRKARKARRSGDADLADDLERQASESAERPDRFTEREACFYGLMFSAYHAAAINMQTRTKAEVLALPIRQRRAIGPDAWIVTRRRADPGVQAFCLNMIDTVRETVTMRETETRDAGPSNLHGIVALLANVAFGTDLNRFSVMRMTEHVGKPLKNK
ncbi:MAG: hypothetical protein B7X49_17150 [Acidiphilium sp. 34-64-41]|nr:MAG: hypothetical protein B7X49_17150 [Acidiphilium sp. 34-64-41]